MTARQMIYGLQDQLFYLFGEVIYDVSTTDLLYYLNKSQNQIIKEKVQVFEQSQYITDELRTLLKEEDLAISTISGRILADLPSDYNILIKHKVITVGDCGTKTVPGVLVQNDDIYQLLKDPFWKPIAEEPLYYVFGNQIIYEIPDNSFSITGVNISYIKQENKINVSLVDDTMDVDSELPEFIHDEIINIARELIIKDKNLQIN